MIRVEAVRKRYGAVTALDGVSFEVAPREIFGLVGPNGAGKTTLLKALIGVVRPTDGHCSIDGVRVDERPVEARRRAGYLGGEARFYETMRARALLRFALDGYASVDWGLVNELTSVFGLPLDRRVRTYSHGMKRKLGILTALAPNVPVAILDEPEEGLDPSAKRQFLDLLRRLRAAGRTILLSSHHLDSVAAVCDRVAFLARGKLVDCDTMPAIRERAARRIRVRLAAGADPARLRIDGVADVIARDGEHVVVASGEPLDVMRRLAQLPIEGLEFRQLRLEEIYADLYGIGGAA